MADLEPRNDIESLLQTGYFTTSRATRESSSNPPSPQDDHDHPTAYPPPRPRREIPRYMSRPPPQPTVEDEADSLLKEHGSVLSSPVKEPPSRGDIDQNPIIEEVHEYNPERRFVMLPGSDGPTETPRPEREGRAPEKDDASSLKDKLNGDYAANTTRKYDVDGAPQAGIERRRSRQDLPKIDTDFKPERQAQTQGRHRSRSSVLEERPPPEYYSARPGNRMSIANEDLLSPQVITHATGGRDKVYYDYSRTKPRPAPSERNRSKVSSDRRADEASSRSTQSTSPASARRSTSNNDGPASAHSPSHDRTSESTRYRDEYERRRERRERRGSTYRRESPSSSYRRESPSSSYRRDSPARSRDGRDGRNASNSSGEHALKSPPSNSRRRRSTVVHDDRPFLQAPAREQPHAGSGRSRSRAPASPVPLPSPKLTGPSMSDPFPPSPRASGTFPTRRGSRRDSSLPYPEGDFPPRNPSLSVEEPNRRTSRSTSRAPPNLSSSETMPAVVPTFPPEMSNLVDRRRSPVPPVSEERTPERQFANSQDTAWPPPPFDPVQNGLGVEKSAGSFRRYSEDDHKGNFPMIPECPRRKGVIGKTDWLGLPRCDNFTICPECYTTVFSETSFRNDFVPLPFRPSDKPISCDFGNSPWYRIAFLLTLKNGQPDLRLFHQIANLAGVSNTQPCPGDRPTVRIWYSIKDPYKQTTLPDFRVCSECAKTVEVLLPNLTGTFVPLHTTAAPSRGSCAMHFHADRQRFVLYFDALETTSDQALATTSAPNLASLARTIERLSLFAECREDRPVADENWHVMQYLPELTVCGECFDEVVRPKLEEGGAGGLSGGAGDNGGGGGGGIVARNFYMKPQRLPIATCQLYSRRMRDVFRKACWYNDPKYLEGKVLERRKVEADIHSKLKKLDQRRHDYGEPDEWTEKEVERLVAEWKEWE